MEARNTKYYDDFSYIAKLCADNGDNKFILKDDCPFRYKCTKTGKDCIGCRLIQTYSMYCSLSNIPKDKCIYPELTKLNKEIMIYDEATYEKIEELCEGDNLYNKVNNGNFLMLICSPNSGNGKTSSALRLALKHIAIRAYKNSKSEYRLTVPSFYINWTDYTILKNRSYRNDNKKYRDTGMTWEQVEYICECVPLLVLDDIGATPGNKSELDTLYTIVESRRIQQLSTICTSNNSYDTLLEILGSRNHSRLLDGAEVIVFKDPSHRNEEQVISELKVKNKRRKEDKYGTDVF